MLIFYNIDLHSTKDKAKYELTYYYGNEPFTVTRLDVLSSFLNNNGTRIFLNFPIEYSDYYVTGYCINYVKNNLVGTYLKVLNNYYIDLEEPTSYV